MARPSQLYIWYPDLPTLEQDVWEAGYRISGFKATLNRGDIYLERSSRPAYPNIGHWVIEPFNYPAIHLRAL